MEITNKSKSKRTQRDYTLAYKLAVIEQIEVTLLARELGWSEFIRTL